MGACDFTDVVRGVTEAKDAYRRAVAEAYEYRGSDPYSGTISTTSGVVVAARRPMSLSAARSLAYELLDENDLGIDKGGYAGAIALAPDGESRQVEQQIRLTGEQFLAFVRDRTTLHSLVSVPKGWEVTRVNVTKQDVNFRVETQATDGKRVTRYFIPNDRHHGGWESGFDSQSEARAYLEQMLAQASSSAYFLQECTREYAVASETRREDGSLLVTGRRIIKSATLDIAATMEQQTEGHDGWLLFGWASC